MDNRPSSLASVDRLVRLLEVSRALSSETDLPSLLHIIVNTASELTQSEAVSILLYDPASGELRFEAAPGLQMEDLSNLSVPLESSVAGWVFTNALPRVIQDASRDPRIYREVDQALNFQTHSILAVPLMVKRETIGVIEAVNKKNHGDYTEDDLAILETLATQAAIAIQNARLFMQLQEANKELMQLDRMKSDFIAIASHELRTPLGLILGHATFLKDSIDDPFKEQMEIIVRSTMRLKNIIEDLSAIAHKEQGLARVRRAPFSMTKLIKTVVSRFQESASEKEILLAYDLPDDPLVVEGERDKIDVVLSNLVRNAITFTDKGGQVGVKAEYEAGYVKAYVVDTGIGIPAKEIDRVFERFYQVESHLTRRHGGMGLGLSIAKAMVEMHNGQIWCESQEGKGSLFAIMLPVDQRQASAAARVFKTA